MPTPLPVDVENDWVDYTTAVGGVLGGLGAIAAAVVAIIAVRAQASATDRAERGQRRVAKQALYQEVFAYMASATKEPAVAANILGRMQVGASNAALEAWTRYTRDTSPENRDALMTVLNKELNELNTDAS